MDILVITQKAASWNQFQETLGTQHHLHFATSKAEAHQQCLAQRYDVLLWDEVDRAIAMRDDVIEFLMLNAAMHQAMVIDADPDQFHEDTEGLGILPPISPLKNADAADTFLASIAKIDATFAKKD